MYVFTTDSRLPWYLLLHWRQLWSILWISLALVLSLRSRTRDWGISINYWDTAAVLVQFFWYWYCVENSFCVARWTRTRRISSQRWRWRRRGKKRMIWRGQEDDGTEGDKQHEVTAAMGTPVFYFGRNPQSPNQPHVVSSLSRWMCPCRKKCGIIITGEIDILWILREVSDGLRCFSLISVLPLPEQTMPSK